MDIFNTMAVLGTKYLNKLPNVIKTVKIKIIKQLWTNYSTKSSEFEIVVVTNVKVQT